MLGRTHSVNEILDALLDETIRVLGVAAIANYISSDDGRRLILTRVVGRDPSWLPMATMKSVKEIPMEDPDDPTALAARSREIVALENQAQMWARFSRRAATLRSSAQLPGAALFVPMVAKDQAIGAIVLGWVGPRRFRLDDRSWAQGIAQSYAFAVERTRLFERERRARMQAEDAIRASDQFFTTASSELRAPLNAIIEWAERLKGAKAADRFSHDHGLGIIQNSARAQARLVDDIIEMSRAAARGRPAQVTSFELAEQLKSWVSDMRDQAGSKGVVLDLGANAKAALAADPELLRMAMHKVLANAIESVDKGGRVRVDSEVREGRVSIQVRDNDGSGLDPEELKRILSKTHIQRQRGVHDEGETRFELGLATANVVVRQLGGTMSVESPGPRRGTTVTMTLPILEPTAGVLTASSSEAHLLVGLRVLAIDDERETLEALGEMLASEGAQVRSETSAEAGVAAVTEFSPNVVVCDMEMPEHDGGWFIREVRGLDTPLASVPALALTSHTKEECESAALNAGFQRCLPKPPRPQELIASIAEISPRA
jgi:signal transduction histidine kinase